jgi:leader peptidase (prepilin peptidase)/N-methyltransferase
VTALTAVIAALFGAAIGSFLNVVIHRVPRGISIVRPPSACPHCGAEIRARDNIPIVSFLIRRGRCYSCGGAISARYPLVEALTAAFWAAAALRFGVSERGALVALSGTVLIVLSFIDLEHRRLPNVIVLPSIAIAAVWLATVALVASDLDLLLTGLACGAAFFALLFVIAFVSGGMGFGDVKLAAFLGLVSGRFGWEETVTAVFAAFFIGGAAGIVAMAVQGKGRKARIPFGPALAAGAVVALFVGPGPARAWLGL